MSDQSSVESYRDLEVWQRGIVLVERVYEATDGFPDREQYELTSQLRRAVVAIPSNIAEGWGYSSRDQYVYYLEQGRSSLLEVETQLIIAERLSYITEDTRDDLLRGTTVESKMLLSLMRSLQS
ncbi:MULTISPECIES: four helix bundle protein [Salinibacter]|jgi:four helix bundle protein|uniref:four helix bundle protein n=1 Tax=Salinibacter TaxID=146918 RepID=UPI001ABBBF84|nr:MULTISPECIES: four helix bundle protein [Salinibacter]